MAIIGEKAKAREQEFANLIPKDITMEWYGTSRVWTRKSPTHARDLTQPQTYSAYLDWRGERQALPRGSSPLKAFGGKTICGQEWTTEEIDAYVMIYDIGDYGCIFEYTREEPENE